MAETTGLVQRMALAGPTITCVWIGPKPNNVTALLVTNDGTANDVAYKANLTDTLAAASTNYRQVTAIHADDDTKITAVRLENI